LTYRFGSRIGGDDYPDIRLAVAQLNFGDVHRRCQERSSLFGLAFDNGFADHKAASEILNGNNPATFFLQIW